VSSAPTATTFEGSPVDSADGVGSLTFAGFLAEVVNLHGSDEAIVFDDALLGGSTVRWSYERLGSEARRVARSLLAAGITSGDTVAIVMGNRPEAIAAIFGAALVGAVAAPVSTFSPAPELEHLLGLCSARVVLTQRELLGRRFDHELQGLAPRLPALERTVTLGTDSWDAFLEAGTRVPEVELTRRCGQVDPSDPALVIFSSGTTAAPKGILHTNRAPTLQFWLQARIFGRHRGTRMLSALPIFWTAGLNSAVGSTLAAGGCWVAQETFHADEALALIERERVTEPYTLPHQTAAMAESPQWLRTDLSSVRCAYGKGAYARHPSAQPDPHWIMPVGYGMSETCAFVAGYRSDDSREQMRIGSGRLLPGVRLRVLDPDTGRALDVDEEGELAVAGATLMIGYLGRDPADCVDVDGFFHTGDAGRVDAQGIVHFSGRRTEMIKTGGANVSPAEVEVALRAFPSVKLSRVLGVPDERLDQIAVACVVCKEGTSATEAEVKAFLRERIAAYKVPKRVVFVDTDEVPMTAGGTKVRDDDLRALVLERLARHDPSEDRPTSRHEERA
jgi:fatty-acyl-CoA synthase